jgi:Domain of unknown function (DUF5668)
MAIYIRNRHCHCMRCRTRGLTGGAILVTLGILFLLDNYGFLYFDDSWPVLLIVIGLLSFAARSASTEGHIQAGWPDNQVPPPGYNATWQPNSGPQPGQTGAGPEVKS